MPAAPASPTTCRSQPESSPATTASPSVPPDSSNASSIAEVSTPVSAGVMAGIAKSLATKSAFAATAFGKGLLKWWFRVPVKLFRPHTVSPWLVVNALAREQGAKVGVGYMRAVVAEEGYGFLGKNIIPLLFANAVAGAVLFNVYASTISALSNSDSQKDSLSAALAFDHHYPFIAGALAGASTSLISTPLDNIKANITASDLVAHRHEGMLKFSYRTVQNALKDEKNIWAKCRRLYKGIGFLATKDALGFGLFFFFFEGIRKSGKGLVADVWGLKESASEDTSDAQPVEPTVNSEDPKRRSLGLVTANAAAVIVAGGVAGAAYQSLIYPLDNIPAVIAATRVSEATKNPLAAEAAAVMAAPIYEDGFHNANPAGAPSQQRFTWTEVWQVVRQRGLRPFYAGITPQLVRVMPPSAIGLFAYEIASSQFWDNDET